MEVILLKDVKGKGKKGTVIKVNAGYAKNFLIPNKVAIVATSGALNIKDKIDLNNAKNFELEKQKSQKIAKKIESIELKFELKNNNGKLFGHISAKQIIAQFLNHNIKIKKTDIIPNKIDSLGKTTLTIQLPAGVKATAKTFTKGI